jgi:putative transposase
MGGDGGNTAPLSGDTVFLKRLYVLFLHVESRRILFAACTESPDSGWITQQARNLTWELTELGLPPRFLICDRDAKFAAAFRFRARDRGDGSPAGPTAKSAGELDRRALGRFRSPRGAGLASGRERAPPQVHPEGVLEHYNRARPHRSLDLRPPTGDPPLAIVTLK